MSVFEEFINTIKRMNGIAVANVSAPSHSDIPRLIANQIKLKEERDSFKAVLNLIAIPGSGPDAYTSDFTNNVMGWVREALNETRT